MSTNDSTLTAERLRELLHYAPMTGVFTWAVRISAKCKPGMIAGSISPKGYRKIAVERRLYRAARLAWLYVHGEWPKDQIDHINRVRNDDRIANLRDVSQSVNVRNQGVRSNALCVSKNSAASTYQARFTKAGVRYYVGSFATKEEAVLACAEARRNLGAE